MKVLLSLWDLFFYEGSVVLFQITMGMLKLKVGQLACSLVLVINMLNSGMNLLMHIKINDVVLIQFNSI